MIVVYGNYGEMLVNERNGRVIRYTPSDEGSDYADIVRVDLKEFALAYPGETHSHIDIVDIGFWTNTGEYCAPEPIYRATVVRDSEITLEKPTEFRFFTPDGDIFHEFVDPEAGTEVPEQLAMFMEMHNAIRFQPLG
ncbi:hypothetical protein ACUN0C_19035 [Faunimonas sp. B44]|uniref:hypothetical protein n=1 Tax=Faunimonas sp. B44 TaxID=3461493 RepID=UPI004044BB0B